MGVQANPIRFPQGGREDLLINDGFDVREKRSGFNGKTTTTLTKLVCYVLPLILIATAPWTWPVSVLMGIGYAAVGLLAGAAFGYNLYDILFPEDTQRQHHSYEIDTLPLNQTHQVGRWA